jgi:hypothetical protein
MSKQIQVEMPDGSIWAVPVSVIALNRAEYYKYEFDGDVIRSLAEDTMPLFDDDDSSIEEWAANNMNWDDVKSVAVMVSYGECDFQEGWCNGNKYIVASPD